MFRYEEDQVSDVRRPTLAENLAEDTEIKKTTVTQRHKHKHTHTRVNIGFMIPPDKTKNINNRWQHLLKWKHEDQILQALVLQNTL